jgi:hypothetical protein
MLLIILLGAITKLAMVSTYCDIGPINRNITDWTKVSSFVNVFILNMSNKFTNRIWVPTNYLLSQFTGTWYWLYHVPHKYDDNLDCPMSIFEAKITSGGRVTGYIYVKR